MYEINKLPPAITLGYQGESLVRTIEVDCADWLETYPAGTMAATILLPGYDGVAPLAVDMDGTVMRIPVTRGMTAKAGRGSINLRLLDGDVEKRSAVVPVYIQASHPPVSGEMPDPVQDWVADATSKLAETIAATEAANEAAGRANEISETMEGIAPLWRKTASGNPVSVYPAPESPLYLKVSGTCTQAGSGDPSPENIRPITPWLAKGASVSVAQTGGATITLTAPQDVYGGWVDNEGRGESEWQKFTIDGSQDVNYPEEDGNGNFRFSITVPNPLGHDVLGFFRVSNGLAGNYLCNKHRPIFNGARPANIYETAISANASSQFWAYFLLPQSDLSSLDAAGVKAYFASNPTEIVVKLPTHIKNVLTLPLAPLTALPQLDRITPRQNVLTASTGNIELTYAKSPIQESNEIRAAIALI